MAVTSGTEGGSRPSDRLKQLCRKRIRAAQPWGMGEVYRRLRLRSRWHYSFDLIWDAPTRIVVIACCWTPESLRAVREDMLHLHATLPQLQVYKKLHLILFHADTENASEQPWPSGVSFSQIALDPAKALADPPPFVSPRLDSILGIPQGALASDEVEGKEVTGYLVMRCEQSPHRPRGVGQVVQAPGVAMRPDRIGIGGGHQVC